MSGMTARRSEIHGAPTPVVARLSAQAAEAARRSGFVVLQGGQPECNCPDDCDRDHDNE